MKKAYFLLISIVCSSLLFCSEKGKIALLFITDSDLNQTKIWKNWIDTTLYTVYNKSKNPVLDPWFAQYKIPEDKNAKHTEHGDVLLAQQALLRVALKDPSNVKFVFLTESCVPLKPNFEIYQILTSGPMSHMYWKEPWWHGCHARDLNEFPSQHRLGNHPWMILNRKHAQIIANDNYWIHLAKQHVVCEEAYPSTFFSMLGLLHEFKNEVTTYVNWNKGHLYLFSKNVEEDFKHLMNIQRRPVHPIGSYGYLFARRFSTEFPSDVIQSLIEFNK